MAFRYPIPDPAEVVVYHYEQQFQLQYYASDGPCDVVVKGDYANTGSVGESNVRALAAALTGEEGTEPDLNDLGLADVHFGYNDSARDLACGKRTFAGLPVFVLVSGAWSSRWLGVRRDWLDAHDSDLDALAAATVAAHGVADLDGAIAGYLAGVMRRVNALSDYPVMDENAQLDVESEWEDDFWDGFGRHDIKDLVDFKHRDLTINMIADAWEDDVLSTEDIRRAYRDRCGYFDYDGASAYPAGISAASDVEGFYLDLEGVAERNNVAWLDTWRRENDPAAAADDDEE